MPNPLDILQGQLDRDEAQEVADAVTDRVPEAQDSLGLRWSIEGAILDVYGFDQDEEGGGE